jgi:hypothetical protein
VARIHGRNGRLYVGIASGGTAEPVAFLNKWSMNFSTDDVEVTAFGDPNKTYVAGLPDVDGSFGGFYDNATAQTLTAATDGVARKFYAYPDNTSTSQYWFGTAIFDFAITTGVGEAATVSGNFKASSSVTKVG